MADYISCSNQYIDLLTLLASCFRIEDATGNIVLAIDDQTAFDGSPHICGTNQEVKNLLRQAVSLADDSLPAVRTVITDVANGTGYSVPECAQWQDFFELLKRALVTTTDGTAINIINIT